MRLPDNKRFAFSVLDDTDVATLDYIKPIYDFLGNLGMRTTKTVWPSRYSGPSPFAGSHSLENPEYAEYIQRIQGLGFEIAFHGARMESSKRPETIRALGLFRDLLGAFPRTYAAHATNKENLYWGADRIGTPLLRLLFRVLEGGRQGRFEGHVDGSEYFWGDLAREHLDYVRSFTFQRTDLSSILSNPVYTDRNREWVNRFFITADAEHVEDFVRLLRTENQERLEREGGVCIVSTHFGKGFVRGGEVRSDFRKVLEELSLRDGWFVPVADILDHVTRIHPPCELTRWARGTLEFRWMLDLVKRRIRRRDYDKTEIEYLTRSLQNEEGSLPGDPAG